MDKKQIIQDAYGSYWAHVKEFVDENGWVNKSMMGGNMDMYFEENVGPIDYEKHPLLRWRPESLRNI